MADGNSVTIGGVDFVVSANSGQFRNELKRSESAARSTGGVIEREFNRADAAAERLNATLKRGTSSLALFGVGFGAGAVLKGIVDTADAMALLRGRIQNVLTEGENLTAVFGDIFNAAQRNRQSLEATAQLYLRLRTSIRDLNHEQALGITSTFAKTLVLSGASASEAASATLQFAQAMSKGRLDGDELRSVLEADSRFALLLADSLGVTVGQLRDLGEAGVLTSGLVKDALSGQSGKIEAEFANVPLTVGQAFQQLQNAIVKYVGDTDKALGASQRVAQGIGFLTAHVEDLGAAIAVIAGAGAGAAGGVGLLFLGRQFLQFAGAMDTALRTIASDANLTTRIAKNLKPLQDELDATTKKIKALEAARDATFLRVSILNADPNVSADQRKAAANTLLIQNNDIRAAEAEAKRLVLRIGDAEQRMRGFTGTFVGGLQTIGSGLKSLTGQVLGLFGGPVGLAITAFSVASGVIAYNMQENARQIASVANGLQTLTTLRDKDGKATEEAAAATGELAKQIKNQGDAAKIAAGAQEALNTQNKIAARQSISSGLDDARRQLPQAQNRLNQFTQLLQQRRGPTLDPALKADYERLQKQAQQDVDYFTSVIPLYENGLKQIDAGLADVGSSAKKVGDELTPAQAALEKFNKAMTALRGTTLKGPDKAKFQSSGTVTNLKTLAETDLTEARKQFESVKDLLSPQDAAKIQATFKTMGRALVSFKGDLKQSLTPLQEFAKVLREIREADSSQGNKSLATVQAILDLAKSEDLKNLPAALNALSDSSVSKLLKPADAERVKFALQGMASEALNAFGDPARQAAVRYAEAVGKIALAEAANPNTPKSFFDAERQQALVEFNNATIQAGTELEDLRRLIDDTATPADKLADALRNIKYIESATYSDSTRDTAIARAKINLLDEQARAAGEAAGALAELNALAAASGLTPAEIRAAAQSIRDAASGGRQGRRPDELTGRGVGEQLSNVFAKSFSTALVQGVQSGDYGTALKDVTRTALVDALTGAFEEAGKSIGRLLFENDGVTNFLARGFGSGGVDQTAQAAADLGKSLGTATASTETFSNLLAGTAAVSATTSATADVAQAASATTTATTLQVLSAAAIAAAAALNADTTSDVVGTVVSVAGAFAHGGRVNAGEPIVVGEAGREVFVPSTSGTIVPNSRAFGATPGAGGVAAAGGLVLNVDNSITVQGDMNNAEAIANLQRRQDEQARAFPRQVKAVMADVNRRTP